MPSTTCCLRIWALTSGVELVVDVVAAGLVLDERERVRQLADIVVIRCHAGHQRIGADRLGRALGEVADHQRVVVRAGRLDQEPAQERLRRVRQLEQLEDGQDPEHRAERRERADRRDPRSGGRCRRGEPQLEHAAQVAGAEQREDQHDQRLDHEDRDRGLDEDLQPVATPDGDDAGHPAEEDVGRELERAAVHRATDDRHDGDHEGGDRRVEQDRQEHRDRRGRQEERQRRAAGRDLEGERGPDDQQPDQDQDVVAMPERRAEAPQPGQQHPDHEHRQEQPAAEAGHVGDRLAQPERVDLLDVGRAQRRPVADDDLALADRDGDRRDRLGGLVARLLGQVEIERGVRDDERADDLGGEHPLGLVELAGHPSGETRLACPRRPCRAARSAASHRGRAPIRSGPPPSPRDRARRASPSRCRTGRAGRRRAGSCGRRR